MAVIAAQDGCTWVAAGRALGPFYSTWVRKTRIQVRWDWSKLGSATWNCCTGRSKIGCGCCPVAQYRRWDNRPQMMCIVTAVG
jgi:hypothetical protein